MGKHFFINNDGVTWGSRDDGDEVSDGFPLRPYKCRQHVPVDTGMKWAYCKVCDCDLRLDDKGNYTEEEKQHGDS